MSDDRDKSPISGRESMGYSFIIIVVAFVSLIAAGLLALWFN